MAPQTPFSTLIDALRLAVEHGTLPPGNLLAALPLHMQRPFWRRVTDAINAAPWDWIPPASSQPPADAAGHAERRPIAPFEDAHLRPLTRAGIRTLMRLEVRLAAERLGRLLSPTPNEADLAALSEHCARIGQLAAELAQRVDGTLALLFLDWEARLLRYWFCGAVVPLIFKDVA